ncbi:Guanylate kinase [Nesidiocoris tenuis]|uniref:Dynein axonemal assembly factor 1 homolog n=1 Tax=Nesidiocoris tenuis TaxID=355587 RepID=A0ABN7ANK5_9HEMI|nr:Guanylate kinase [Nesidiocoris tenuis]
MQVKTTILLIMDVPKCVQTTLWEADENFHTKRNKEDELTKNAILQSLGIPKTDNVRPVCDASSDSDDLEFSEIKFDVRLDPECGYPCEKDLGWFDMAMSAAPWDDSRRPYVQVTNPEDLKLTEKEQNGELSGMVVSTGIRYFDAVPLNDGFALVKLELSGRGLTNVQLLDRYKYLQFLDVSNNAIQDLSPIERLVHLVHLDASHNEIARYDPKPTPWFIAYLNLSFNSFETIPDVSSMWSLKYLNLSNNQISKIEGIKKLHYLEHLDLSHNNIEIIGNIDDVPLKTLNLSWNRIASCAGPEDDNCALKNVLSLRRLDLSHNEIVTMSSLACMSVFNLRHLNISYNQFDCLSSFDDLARYSSLRYLRIQGNRLIDELPDIISTLMYMLPQLGYIDGRKLTKIERLSAFSTRATDPIISEMKNYCYDLLYSNAEPPKHGGEAPPHLDYDMPVVILVGPAGTKKNTIAKLLEEKFPDNVRVPALHTTMYPFNLDDDVTCQEHKSMKLVHLDQGKFNSMRNRGEFLFVHSDSGDQFGLSRSELMNDDRLCLIPLPIGPALSISWQGLNTTLIRLKALDDKDYKAALQEYAASQFLLVRLRDENEFWESEDQNFDNEIHVDIRHRRSTKTSHASSTRSRRSRSKSVGEESIASSKTGRHTSDPLFGRPSSEKPDHLDSASSIVSTGMLVQPTVWWSDEDSDEAIGEEAPEIKEKKDISYIDTLAISKTSKQQIRQLYEKYRKERPTYDAIDETFFGQTIVVKDVASAMKKLAPILVEKYNSNLNNRRHNAAEKDDLYDKLVEPRLNELMEILSDKKTIDDLVPPEIHLPTLDCAASLSNLNRSFAKTLSHVSYPSVSNPSTSIIESEMEDLGRRAEKPSDIMEERVTRTPPSTPSDVLQVIAKESVRKDRFFVADERENFKYNLN